MRPVYCSAAPADLYRSLALALTVPWRVCLLRPQRTLVEVCCLRSRRCKWTHVQTPSHLVENTFDLAECPALLSSCTRACRTCVSTSTLCGCVVPLPTQIKIAASHSHRLYYGCFRWCVCLLSVNLFELCSFGSRRGQIDTCLTSSQWVEIAIDVACASFWGMPSSTCVRMSKTHRVRPSEL